MSFYRKMFKTAHAVLASLLLCIALDASALENRPTNVPPAEFPERLKAYAKKNARLLQKGVVDVTRFPYNAAGNGVTDDTVALQKAIDDAYANNFIVFFPAEKTFLVSGQLRCTSQIVSRKIAHQLIGATSGRPPVIKLKDGSRVADGILIMFNLDDKKKGSSPASHYGATLRGIHVDMGSNPDVTAVSMSGAQHCVIEDIKIYGKKFYAGVNGLPGSGGGSVNVEVVGGRIGILQNNYRPNPTIEGLRLDGQSECGIKLQSTRGPLVVSGFEIRGPSVPNASYRAISLKNTSKFTVPNGIVDHAFANLCLTDGTIEVRGEKGVAVFNSVQDVTFRNVYVKAATIIDSGSAVSNPLRVKGDPMAWKRIGKYAFTSKLDRSSVVVDGRNLNDRSKNFAWLSDVTNEAPKEDLVKRHGYGDIPGWDDAGLIDVVLDYGATPEGVNAKDDDGKAIQRALDDAADPKSRNFGKTVLIPRGHFDLAGPLIVRKGTKLIGAGKNISVLQPMKEWSNSKGAIVSTADSREGNIVLSDLSIWGYPKMCYLRVASAHTLVRNIITENKLMYEAWKKRTNFKPSNKRGVPYIDFVKHAGGSVYHLSMDHIMGLNRAPEMGRIPGYHLLRVRNTWNPLAFYQISIEHHVHSPQVMIENVKNLSIYGLKFEPPSELLNIIDSENVQIHGGSGNYYLNRESDRAIVVIENSSNVLIRNMDRKSQTSMFGKKIDDICRFWLIYDGSSITGDHSVLWCE